MKIILIIGNAPNQKALANKVAAEFDLIGLVIEKKPGKKQKLTVGRVVAKLKNILLFSKISNAWSKLLRYYDEQYPTFPTCDTKTVNNVNDAGVIDFINEKNPELVMVSGTSLIKKPFFQIKPSKGIINLHTGLSPYIKGGPNCTNWCLATDRFHLIGNTIMWLDAGIDTGNIITTELVNFTGEESLNDIHLKVMEDAHTLYLRSLRLIYNNPSYVPSVKQNEITKGTLYLTKMWIDQYKSSLLKNIKAGRFRNVIHSMDYKLKKSKIITVPLPENNKK